MSTNFTVPQNVGSNIARAKALLRRDETIRALESLLTALDLYEPDKLMGKVRFEVEVLIQECIQELNRQPKVRALFEVMTKSGQASVVYTPRQEKKLKQTLTILHKALNESDAARERDVVETREKRKASLREKGLGYLRGGDAPRGKAALRVLADEFGNEPGVLRQVGEWLVEAELYYDAVEFLEQAIESFPRDSKAYALAVSCYMTAREFEKAEAVYLKVIRQFGKHTKTMTNLAKLYRAWNKKDQAFEAANEAVFLDGGNEEARTILEELQ